MNQLTEAEKAKWRAWREDLLKRREDADTRAKAYASKVIGESSRTGVGVASIMARKLPEPALSAFKRGVGQGDNMREVIEAVASIVYLHGPDDCAGILAVMWMGGPKAVDSSLNAIVLAAHRHGLASRRQELFKGIHLGVVHSIYRADSPIRQLTVDVSELSRMTRVIGMQSSALNVWLGNALRLTSDPVFEAAIRASGDLRTLPHGYDRTEYLRATPADVDQMIKAGSLLFACRFEATDERIGEFIESVSDVDLSITQLEGDRYLVRAKSGRKSA